MKKVLFVATVTSHIKAFHIPYLKWFKENGYEVHVASNGEDNIEYCDKHFNLNFQRFPLKIQNIKVYKELKKIIEENKYEIIHCHTPVGGVLTRLAASKLRKKYNTKVIYTAHGFHFYKGAPILNWIIYYPIEKIMAKYTDCLITITKEDYELAIKKLKKIKQIKYINGVGFNTERFNVQITDEDKEKLRQSLSIKSGDIVFTYVAELNKNKNQKLLINVIEQLKDINKNVKLLLVGDGNLKEEYIKIIKEKNMENNILVLGKRLDVPELLSITDIYLASSKREGLPVNIMEAMYMKLPIIALDNRGHRELIKDNENGFLIYNEDMMERKIVYIIQNREIKEKLKEKNLELIENYKIENVIKEIKKVYKGV